MARNGYDRFEPTAEVLRFATGERVFAKRHTHAFTATIKVAIRRPRFSWPKWDRIGRVYRRNGMCIKLLHWCCLGSARHRERPVSDRRRQGQSGSNNRSKNCQKLPKTATRS